MTAQRQKRRLLDIDNENEKWPTANPDELLNIGNNGSLVFLLGLSFPEGHNVAQRYS